MANMLYKTQNLAVKIAQENKVNHEGQIAIKSLIEAAFQAYAKEWSGTATLRQTKATWEYFYNTLTEFEKDNSDISDLNIVADFKKHANFAYPWDALFYMVIQIMFGKI